jgi:hypothetical protein
LVAFAGASAANDTAPSTSPRPRAMVISFFIIVISPLDFDDGFVCQNHSGTEMNHPLRRD